MQTIQSQLSTQNDASIMLYKNQLLCSRGAQTFLKKCLNEASRGARSQQWVQKKRQTKNGFRQR